jgi:hypothetical protein
MHIPINNPPGGGTGISSFSGPPILIDTLFTIQYSSIETEAIVKPFLKIVGRGTASEERLFPWKKNNRE